jgi:hypothetical protein
MVDIAQMVVHHIRTAQTAAHHDQPFPDLSSVEVLVVVARTADHVETSLAQVEVANVASKKCQSTFQSL